MRASVCVSVCARDGFADLGFDHPAEPAALCRGALAAGTRGDAKGKRRGVRWAPPGSPGPSVAGTVRVRAGTREAGGPTRVRVVGRRAVGPGRGSGPQGAGGSGERAEPPVTESPLLPSADHGPARRPPARRTAARRGAQPAGLLTGPAAAGDPDAASCAPPARRPRSESPPGPGRAAPGRRRRAGAGARHGWPRLRAAAASAVGAREPGPPQRRAPRPGRARRAARRALPAREVLPVAAARGLAHRSVPAERARGARPGSSRRPPSSLPSSPRSLRFHFPAPARRLSRRGARSPGPAAVEAGPRGRSGLPGALSTGQPRPLRTAWPPAPALRSRSRGSLPPRPETFRAGPRGAFRGDNTAVVTGRGGGTRWPREEGGGAGARSWGCGVRRANPVSIKSLEVSGREWVCRGASAGARASGIPAPPAAPGEGGRPGFRCRRVQSGLAPRGESGRPSPGREPLPEAGCGGSWPRPPSSPSLGWGRGFPGGAGSEEAPGRAQGQLPPRDPGGPWPAGAFAASWGPRSPWKAGWFGWQFVLNISSLASSVVANLAGTVILASLMNCEY